MNRLLLLIALCFGTCLATNVSCAACAVDDPVVIAKQFYVQHRNFHTEAPASIKAVTAPRLLAVLEKEFICRNGEICAIEADPWTDAQDGEMGGPIRYTLASNSGSVAKVQMSYTLVLSKTQRRPQRVTLLLQRNTASECWLISDLVGPRGSSLLTMLEKWHQESGGGR